MAKQEEFQKIHTPIPEEKLSAAMKAATHYNRIGEERNNPDGLMRTLDALRISMENDPSILEGLNTLHAHGSVKPVELSGTILPKIETPVLTAAE